MTKHNGDYHSECEPPYLSWRWKVGQVWLCPCGNAHEVIKLYSSGGNFKVWSKKGVINK